MDAENFRLFQVIKVYLKNFPWWWQLSIIAVVSETPKGYKRRVQGRIRTRTVSFYLLCSIRDVPYQVDWNCQGFLYNWNLHSKCPEKCTLSATKPTTESAQKPHFVRQFGNLQPTKHRKLWVAFVITLVSPRRWKSRNRYSFRDSGIIATLNAPILHFMARLGG